MRVLIVCVLGACSFSHGTAVADAPPDIKPDMPMPTWAIDSTSKKGVPGNSAEWDKLAQAAALTTSAPNHLWLMQETVGDLDDSIGTTKLMALNVPTYSNPVVGWSRVAVGTNDSVANQGFDTTATGFLNGSSYLMLAYVAMVTPPAAERSVLGLGGGNDHRYVTLTPMPVFKGTGTGVTPTLGTVNPMTAVHPLVLEIDATQHTYVVYTDQEKLSVNWAGTTGGAGLVIFGNASIGSAAARYLYGALWSGTKAEMSDADVKKLLQSLGWTVTGY